MSYASRRLGASQDAADAALVARLSADLRVDLFAVGSPGVGGGEALAQAFGKRVVWFREGAAPSVSIAWTEGVRLPVAAALARECTDGRPFGLFGGNGQLEHAVVCLAGGDVFVDARGTGLGENGFEERRHRYVPGPATWRPLERQALEEAAAGHGRTVWQCARRFANSLLETLSGSQVRVRAAVAPEWAPDVIFLGAHRLATQERVVAHEIAHLMEVDEPELYRALKDYLLGAIPSCEPYARVQRDEGYLEEGLADELVADCVEQFLGDPVAVAQLLGRVPTLAERVHSFCLRALQWLESRIGHQLGSAAITAQSPRFEALRAPILEVMSSYRHTRCYKMGEGGQPVPHATPTP